MISGRQPVLNQDNTFTEVWFKFFSNVDASLGSSTTQPSTSVLQEQIDSVNVDLQGNVGTKPVNNAEVVATRMMLEAVYAPPGNYTTPSTAPVTSVFTRTGNVIAAAGDYNVSQVTGAAQGGASRPGSPFQYQYFFDTTLGQPIWWTGSNWVNSAGVVV